MRARMAIHYANITTVLREVVLRDKPIELLELSPKATVPVLVLEDGRVIDESLDIMYWALAISDDNGWLNGLTEQQLALAKKLITENDDGFKLHLDHYKYAERFPEQSMEGSREKAEVFLRKLEQHLQQHHYLLGNELSFADIAIFPFIRQFAHVDLVWFEQTPYSKLQQWLRNLRESQIFTDVMVKHQAWQAGDKVCYL